MPKCKLCGKEFKIITNSHLNSKHKTSLKSYTRNFGSKNCGFLSPNLLPKNDFRYIKWRESLKKRPGSWSKGYTKETHPSVAKISKTFKKKKIDNFANWRNQMVEKGLIKRDYPPFEKSADLAELIGVVLGDGHIGKFPRAEILAVFSNCNNPGFVNRYATLIEKIFEKEPVLAKRKGSNCIKVSIYQKEISKRLKIPYGARKNQIMKTPYWILRNKEYLRRYLRGLYEAEGSFSVHRPTYTYKFLFSNRNKSLLDNVYNGLIILGFHPHRSSDKIQISKKEEVYNVKHFLEFREY